MIQDILPSRMDISYKKTTPKDDSVIVAFKDGEMLVAFDEKELAFPRLRDMNRRRSEPQGEGREAVLSGERADRDVTYLFCVDDEEYFICFDAPEPPAGYEYKSARELRKLKTASTKGLFIAFTAYHLYTWYETSRFCGRCGERTQTDASERALVCPACGNKIYPRINPAVIIGVRNGERILITKYRTGFGHSALVAGFAEIGETLEDTVRREVMEEVGLKVKNITYYKSQPWGIVADLLAGFYCDVDGDDTIKMDEGELKYAEWVEREKIELQPNDISLTNEMMKVFKFGR